MKKSFVLYIILIGLWGCEQKPYKPFLLGAWKVDSTYSYYNGFSYTERKSGGDWAKNIYSEDGLMKEVKYQTFQSYHYSWQGLDTIVLRSTSGGQPIYYQLLGLTQEQLILKKTKRGLFSEIDGERYEIRYMSRTNLPSEEIIPFVDPR
ncbi:hypothetical protein [Membranihabitans marinus]|uniref:hypothetical protein n=1 Tax=Membranihabitans marinus TaxID=1227546 RepID=UPI001F181AA9|nr:hypothetical protein [Membranihabitans marinus]